MDVKPGRGRHLHQARAHHFATHSSPSHPRTAPLPRPAPSAGTISHCAGLSPSTTSMRSSSSRRNTVSPSAPRPPRRQPVGQALLVDAPARRRHDLVAGINPGVLRRRPREDRRHDELPGRRCGQRPEPPRRPLGLAVFRFSASSRSQSPRDASAVAIPGPRGRARSARRSASRSRSTAARSRAARRRRRSRVRRAEARATARRSTSSSERSPPSAGGSRGRAAAHQPALEVVRDRRCSRVLVGPVELDPGVERRLLEALPLAPGGASSCAPLLGQLLEVPLGRLQPARRSV